MSGDHSHTWLDGRTAGFVLLALAAFALAFYVFSVALTQDASTGKSWRMNVGSGGGVFRAGRVTVVIPQGALDDAGRLSVREVSGSASELLPGTVPRSPMFEIKLDRALRKAVELRFALASAPRSARSTFAATRERPSEMWLARRGSYDRTRRELHVKVTQLSNWQPVEAISGALRGARNTLGGATDAAVDLGVKADSAVLQFGGVRAREPTCGTAPAGFALSGDTGIGDANALAFACFEESGQDMRLRLVNNRAIGVEFDLPGGLRVGRLKGSGLSDEVFTAALGTLSSRSWRTISSTGEAELDGPPSEISVTLRPTLRAFAFDTSLFAIGQLAGKKAKAVAATANYLNCAWTQANRLRDGVPHSPQEALDAATGVWRECGDTLKDAGGGAQATAGALFFGGIKLGVGATDALAALANHDTAHTTVLVKRVSPHMIDEKNNSSIKPARIDLASMHAVWIDGLSWTAWGEPQNPATAQGQFHINSCQPDCSYAHYVSARVRVELSRLVNCPSGPEYHLMDVTPQGSDPHRYVDHQTYESTCGEPLTYVPNATSGGACAPLTAKGLRVRITSTTGRCASTTSFVRAVVECVSTEASVSICTKYGGTHCKQRPADRQTTSFDCTDGSDRIRFAVGP